ncbi:hypothetical protein GR11A_00201 [Vibrio phage vB_VcorM_GR11A]|nr:hypothetical protein GR11A_00201 [Vibrio phage vB_VcorM_GR11A]
MGKKKELRKKLKRVKRKAIKEIERRANLNENTATFHGGRALGYFEGKRSLAEDLLDILEDT